MGGAEQHDMCWRLMRQRRYSEALEVAQKLCQIHPNEPESWYTLSAAARGARLGPLALKAIDKALTASPNNFEYLAHKALCLLSVGCTVDAVHLARRIKTSNSVSLDVLNTIALVFQAGGEFKDQLEVTSNAISIAPKNTQGIANHADALRNFGKLAEAQEAYSLLIDLDPSSFSAYWNRSQCLKATEEHNFVCDLKTKLTELNLPWRGKMQLDFALARELEELGQFDESFDYLLKANKLRRDHSNYDVQGDIRTIEEIISTYSRIPLNYDGFDSSEPIFVLGLPRSGTSLVERILGGHSDVFDAGELQNFPTEMIKLIQQSSGGKVLDKLGTVRASINSNWHDLGRAYVESTRPRTGTTKHFIDKLPTNYLYVGLIMRALPNARVILVERDPMDSCYAMYKTLFGEAYPFTYSQSDLGHYYAGWRRLMDHWKSQFSKRIFCIHYESVVQDTENSVRDLLDFCGLEWQSECLQFHSRSSAISTASASQVRQPIYTSSVGKWRHFEKRLEPLIDILRSANIGLR